MLRQPSFQRRPSPQGGQPGTPVVLKAAKLHLGWRRTRRPGPLAVLRVHAAEATADDKGERSQADHPDGEKCLVSAGSPLGSIPPRRSPLKSRTSLPRNEATSLAPTPDAPSSTGSRSTSAILILPAPAVSTEGETLRMAEHQNRLTSADVPALARFAARSHH